jgi:uncharacterized membrane protein YbhN (UPF0104 family)
MVLDKIVLWPKRNGAKGQGPLAAQPHQANAVHRDGRRLRNGALWAAALLLLLLGIGLAVPDLRGVLDRASQAAPGWLVLAVALELASCLGYVATMRLVLPRGPAREVRRLAWAEMAFGAVVPAGGAGSLAVGAWAMRAWGVAWSRIANRSAVIFLLTSAVNVVVLGVGGLGVLGGLGAPHTSLVYGLVPAVVAVLVLGFFMALPRLPLGRRRGGRVMSALQRTASWVSDTEEIAFAPNWRLLGTVGYLVFDIAVLWACLRAVGVSAPIFALVLGYQIGYLANLVPIPGGVGALEGGLLGALLLYGLPAAPTAAAVVLYHAIALWLPTLGGTVGFLRLRRALASRERAGAEAQTPASGERVGARTQVDKVGAVASADGAGARAQALAVPKAPERPVRDLAA